MERGEVDYLRGVIYQGMVIIIRGNTVNVKLQSRQVKINVPPKIVLMNLLFES